MTKNWIVENSIKQWHYLLNVNAGPIIFRVLILTNFASLTWSELLWNPSQLIVSGTKLKWLFDLQTKNHAIIECLINFVLGDSSFKMRNQGPKYTFIIYCKKQTLITSQLIVLLVYCLTIYILVLYCKLPQISSHWLRL